MNVLSSDSIFLKIMKLIVNNHVSCILDIISVNKLDITKLFLYMDTIFTFDGIGTDTLLRFKFVFVNNRAMAVSLVVKVLVYCPVIMENHGSWFNYFLKRNRNSYH